jgi:hypothetical protein
MKAANLTKASSGRQTAKRSDAAPAAKRGVATDKLAGISPAAVEKATGRAWAAWLKLLDADGAADLTHKQIAERLHEKHGVGEWWAQMVTVGYEQARGRRIKHQMTRGFEVTVSKTVNVSVSRLYACWADAKRRKLWLPVEFEVRKATKNKSMRITWPDGTNVDVNFSVKGPEKSSVGVGHAKLADAKAAEKAKKMWKGYLEGMAGVVG